MLKLVKIAIIGGVASGKSSACQFFHELGASVVNADEIVHELLRSDPDLQAKIRQELGSEVLKNGKLDRQSIAKKVFGDDKQLKSLEALIHPRVLRKIEDLYTEACKKKKYTSFVVEIPLLFEIQGESFYDYVIDVLTDESIAKKRFQEKGFQPSDYDQRMKRQLSPDQKAAKSNYVLQNNGSLEDLKKQVIEVNHILHNNPKRESYLP